MFSISQPQAQFKEKIIYLKSGVFYTYYSNFGPISCRAETTEAARMLCVKMLLEKNPACQSWKK